MSARIHRLSLSLLLLALVAAPSGASDKGVTVKGVRYFSYATFTRVVFEIEQAAPYVLNRTADGRGLLLQAYDGPLAVDTKLPAIADGVVAGMEDRTDDGRRTILIKLDIGAGETKDFVLRGPDRIVLDIMRGAAAAPSPPVKTGKAASVVIDPGHGGSRDSGLVTSRGVEKTLTLDWSQDLKKLLVRSSVSLKPALTREKDQALSLNERATVANAAGASLFISIHAAPGRTVRVYILDPEDEPVSRATSRTRDFLGYETQSELQEMSWQRQQAAYAQQSGALGRLIAQQLGPSSGKDAVPAPLALLRPVAAAAVLVEVGVEANAGHVLEAVVKGIEQYARTGR